MKSTNDTLDLLALQTTRLMPWFALSVAMVAGVLWWSASSSLLETGIIQSAGTEEEGKAKKWAGGCADALDCSTDCVDCDCGGCADCGGCDCAGADCSCSLAKGQGAQPGSSCPTSPRLPASGLLFAMPLLVFFWVRRLS